ncbi:MAG: 16S rRNA (guanine(966)-N(2))-methyltransferase RsmD [Gemmatimonadaceae bacterium]
MRIVSGRWKGRAIKAPSGVRVRPTADRVREAWLSILQNEIPGARVLDLCAGSGALGLEALSRGAASVHFVETSAMSLDALRANIDALGAGGGATVHRADALRFASRLVSDEYDVAFADPPYKSRIAEAIALRWLEVPFARTLGVEHSSREILPGGAETRRYGDTAITFYKHNSLEGSE